MSPSRYSCQLVRMRCTLMTLDLVDVKSNDRFSRLAILVVWRGHTRLLSKSYWNLDDIESPFVVEESWQYCIRTSLYVPERGHAIEGPQINHRCSQSSGYWRRARGILGHASSPMILIMRFVSMAVPKVPRNVTYRFVTLTAYPWSRTSGPTRPGPPLRGEKLDAYLLQAQRSCHRHGRKALARVGNAPSWA